MDLPIVVCPGNSEVFNKISRVQKLRCPLFLAFSQAAPSQSLLQPFLISYLNSQCSSFQSTDILHNSVWFQRSEPEWIMKVGHSFQFHKVHDLYTYTFLFLGTACGFFFFSSKYKQPILSKWRLEGNHYVGINGITQVGICQDTLKITLPLLARILKHLKVSR